MKIALLKGSWEMLLFTDQLETICRSVCRLTEASEQYKQVVGAVVGKLSNPLLSYS